MKMKKIPLLALVILTTAAGLASKAQAQGVYAGFAAAQQRLKEQRQVMSDLATCVLPDEYKLAIEYVKPMSPLEQAMYLRTLQQRACATPIKRAKELGITDLEIRYAINSRYAHPAVHPWDRLEKSTPKVEPDSGDHEGGAHTGFVEEPNYN